MDRVLALPAVLLGVLRSGATYIPVDPGFPRERVAMIAEEALASAAIVSEDTRQLIPGKIPVLLEQDAPVSTEPEPHGEATYEPVPVDPDSLAYLIFTSGSTGRPKGVPITHRALSNFLLSMVQRPGIHPDDRVLALTTISFDISLLELLLPLTVGASVHIASAEAVLDQEQLVRFIASNKLTLLQATPATWQMLVEYGWRPTLKQRILCGGDVCPIRLAEKLYQHASAVWNMYGPTEATIWSSCHRVAVSDIKRGRIPLGTPIAGMNYRVDPLAAAPPVAPMQVLRQGQSGELLIAGVGVTPGYFQRPELEDERFVDHVEDGTPVRYYRTGDLVETDAQGRIFYLDRLDSQVKVRGFRVELGEIESALRALDIVLEAAVVLARPGPGEPILVGCVRLEVECADTRFEEHLKVCLPEYMIPHVWVRLDLFPQTPNRKIDRQALRATVERNAHATLSHAQAAFETTWENVLAELWSELLGHRPKHGGDDFLALGGHSLLAARLSTLVQMRFKRNVRPVEFLTGSTLKQHARKVAETPVESVDTHHPHGRLPDWLPLSPAQRQIWFTGEVLRDHRVYNESEAYRIAGPLNPVHLRQALHQVTRRHGALQLQLLIRPEAEPKWIKRCEQGVSLKIVEVAQAALQPQSLAAALSLEAARAFRFAEESLIRFCLFTDGATEHVLQCTAHHMVVDGLSLTVLWREIAKEYRKLQAGEECLDPGLDARFIHYLEQGPCYNASDLGFWRAEFDKPAPPLELATDRPRPAALDFSACQVTVDCAVTTAETLYQVARDIKTTPFVLLLSVYAVLLERYAQQGEYVIGTPVSGRSGGAMTDAVGLFINTMPLRLTIKQGETLRDLIGRVQGIAFRGLAHQQVPFADIVEAVNPPRESSRTPLYQTLFAVNDLTERPAALASDCSWQPQIVETGYAPAELVMFVDLSTEKMQLRLQGSGQLFDRDTLHRMVSHFRTLLESAIEDIDKPWDSVSLLDVREEGLLGTWNLTAADYPRDSSIAACFLNQVKGAPDSLAVEQGEVRVTYAELASYAAKVASDLAEAGVKAGDRVGLAIGRCAEAIGAMLGLLEVGAVYVPLELNYPTARLRTMMEDCQLIRVLVKPADRKRLSAAVEEVGVIALRGFDSNRDKTLHGLGPGANSPAYILFTSGSAGAPKGIVVSHRNVLRLVKNSNFMMLTPETRFLMYAPLSFDAFNLEVWGPLLNGGTVVLPEKDNPSSAELANLLVRKRINSVWLTAALFHHMAEHHPAAFAGTRYLLTGGEVVSPKWARQVLQCNPGLTLVNGYGPTENTTFSSFHTMTDPAAVMEPVPIGRAVANSTCYVLDGNRKRCPINVPGELWVGGDGVALGYVQRRELEHAAFVSDPFVDDGDARMYRTGDRARWLADGNLEFLGRLDSQVKIRGYRIEPDEITAVIERCPGVAQAVTVPWRAPSGDDQLISYTVSSATVSVDMRDLRRRLAETLPHYMQPARIVSLTSMPLGPTGKIDRKALPEPDIVTEPERSLDEAPATPTEQALARIWEEVLGLDRVMRGDNFFTLGGSSIKALAVFIKIEQGLGLDIPLASLLQAPTLAEQAAEIDARRPLPNEALQNQMPARDWESLVVLQPNGEKPPLVCIHAVGGNVLCYRGLVAAAGPDRPVLGFQSRGLDGLRAPQSSVRDMAHDYVSELLQSQFRGPYILLGGSMGGTVALEMAAILKARGEQVEWVILLDSIGPDGRIIPDDKPVIQFRVRFWRSLRARTAFYLKNALAWSYRQIRVPLPYWLRPFFIKAQHKLLLARHRETPYGGSVLLLRGPNQNQGVYKDPFLGWRGTLEGELLIEEIDVPHADFIEAVQTQWTLQAFLERPEQMNSSEVPQAGIQLKS